MIPFPLWVSIITGPQRYTAKYSRYSAGECLLYKLLTWRIYTGLDTQTISDYYKSHVDKTNPLEIGFKTPSNAAGLGPSWPTVWINVQQPGLDNNGGRR